MPRKLKMILDSEILSQSIKKVVTVHAITTFF